MPERTMPLRHPARCTRCGTALAAGTTAHWDPTTRRTRCLHCPDRTRRSNDTAPATTAPVPAPRDEWQRLVDFHLAAVRAAAAPPLPRVHERDKRFLLDLTREDIITGRNDTLRLTPEARRFARATPPQEALLYGWPLVVLHDQLDVARIAPLFLTELGPGHDDDTMTARDAEPFVNPALLSDTSTDRERIDAVHTALADGLGFGDARAVAAAAARVVSALGLAVHALDPDDLRKPGPPEPGVHNTAALVRGPTSHATRALVDELQTLRQRTDWHTTAAAALVRDVDEARAEPLPAPAPALPPAAFDELRLNDSQEQAVGAALSRDVTVVTGPPGTGKSQVVASIVANQWLTGRTVLVASTNNSAVDVAVQRCATLDPALLLRTGNRETRDRLPALLEQLAARARDRGPSHHVIMRQLEVAAANRRHVQAAIEARSRDETTLAQLLVDVELLRARLWGPDTSSAPPVDAVVVRRLVDRAGRRGLFRRRRERRALDTARPTMPGVTLSDVAEWATTEVTVTRLASSLRGAGPVDASDERAMLRRTDAAWESAGTDALRETVQQRLHTGRTALQQLARVRAGGRDARTAALARSLPSALGWACTTLSAQQAFPLTPGLFDLLVVDEASQCSISHILPLAYRARRIVVVGDPNQLSPVVTLDPRTEARLADDVGWTSDHVRRQALSVLKDSTYTAYAARHPDSTVLLAEHYRCHPAIAQFLNEQFYGGMLRILTDVSKHTGAARGLVLVDTPGEVRRDDHGGVCNPPEARAVVDWIVAHTSASDARGVVTPFAAQARLISRLLRERFGETADTIRVGTAHRFQGDERDIMLFSPVLSAGVEVQTARWAETQRNLVNVAVSRARRALVIVGDVAALESGATPTLQALVEMARDGADTRRAENELREQRGLHSDAERRLFGALARAGLNPGLKQVIEGYELDITLGTPSGPLDIEVDGAHHVDVRGRRRRQDLVRDTVLESLGWRVLRVPAWRALAEPEAVADEITRHHR
ncbi:AAA domain-containing protein [Cellulomonas iranensis]|uniref:AAA domain-containing protein n=1 Tax=Cellulomonas iranensis TaxID=76862 RepID=UPI001CF2C4C7|nr:AAA domain-containing protein [Cellulomonas iranensis]UCN14986.1 AAA domain-containing protein [Cellulomonas iranensis]